MPSQPVSLDLPTAGQTLLNTGGRQIYIEQSGPLDGLPVVLLHHGLGSTRAWREQVPCLAAAGYRVIAYDRWGYGRSDARPALGIPHFTPDLEDLSALLDAWNLPRVALVGHSDGGTIALLFAAHYPPRVAALVTVAAHIYVEASMEAGIEAVQRQFLQDKRFYHALRRIHADKVGAVFDLWYQGWRQPECQGWDMRPVLGQISCPALVVQGEGDEHATPRHAQDTAAAIPGAQLWLVPQAGHMLPQTQAELFNARLVEFLAATQNH